MPRDGAGVFSLTAGYLAVNGQPVLPSNHNPPLEDIAAALTQSIARTGVTTVTADIPFNDFKLTGVGDPTLGTDALNRQTGDARYLGTIAQCRLALSGGNLVLSPFGGNRILIDAELETIPSAGVSLTATALTPSTKYFIYAYMNTGTMTLEASTTGYSVSTTTGMPFKTGDATRTLVGMAMPDTGPAWVSSLTKRWVASYWNRRPVSLAAALTTSQGTASTSFTFFAGELTFSALAWSDARMAIAGHVIFSHNTALGRGYAQINSNGAGLEGVSVMQVSAINDLFSVHVAAPSVSGGDALVAIQLQGKTNAGLVTWIGDAGSPDRCSITGLVDQ